MQPVPRLANNDNSCIIHGCEIFVKYGSRSGQGAIGLTFTPLQAPDLLNPVPTWPILLMGLFLLCSAFYLVRKLFHRLTPASRHKG